MRPNNSRVHWSPDNQRRTPHTSRAYIDGREESEIATIQSPNYAEYTEAIKTQIADYAQKAKEKGTKETLHISLPENQKLTPEVLREISVFLFLLSYPSCRIHFYRFRVVLDRLSCPGTPGWTICLLFLERRKRLKCLAFCRRLVWIGRTILFTPICFLP